MSLRPEDRYNSRDLKLMGIGDETIAQARQAGAKPRKFGRYLWYRGAELIEAMDRNASDCNGDSGSSAGTDSGHDAHFSTLVSEG